MAKFTVNPKQLVTSALIHRGRLPENHLPIIAKCRDLQDDEQAAGNAALGLVALGLISGAVLLGSAAVGPFLVMPIVSTLLGGAGYYNHPIRARRRDDEADFLRQNPQVVGLIAGKLADGHNPDVIDAALLECFTQWRSTGQKGLSALTEGHPTQTTLDVPAAAEQPIAPGHPPNVPGHTPIAPGTTQSPIAVHAHTNITNVLPGRQQGQQAKPIGHAIPAPGQVQTEPPDLSLYPDPADRAMALMTAMAKAGMPIGSILKHPFIMAIGGSQSGKTSIATALSVLRMATGCRCTYATVDDDVPPVKWSKLAAAPLRYVEMMDEVAETISGAGKGALQGQSWVFDEVLRSSQEFGADITKLLIPSLTKGAKTGGLLIVLTHAKTVSAHNLKPGFSEAWERDRVAIEALRERDKFGEYSPKGEYLVTIPGEAPEVWRWPEWMLTNLDPVGWMLDAFPEFKGKAIEGADRGQDMPLKPATAAPSWASMGAVQTPVQSGSSVVQGRFSGSGLESGSNHGSGSVQALNQREPGTFGALEMDGSRFMNRFEPAEPHPEPANSPQFFTNLNLNRSDTIDRITALKNAGLNQGQIILALWGCPKGGSKGYTDALAQYKELTGE
jgi:hypothetical protein